MRARRSIGFPEEIALAVMMGVSACDGSPGGPSDCDPFADRVVSFDPGVGAGNGQDRLPGVVLGPPVGGGVYRGSGQVMSAGRWDVTVTVTRGGQRLGSSQLAVVAR